jgi:hypothetical protein
MRAPFRILVAVAALLLAGSNVSYAAAAEPAPSTCSHGGVNYGQGEFICVAPGYAQICDTNNTWKAPESHAPYDGLCAAKATQIIVPPAQCIYHDVRYTTGASICVGPNYPMKCTEKGSWDLDQRAPPNVKDLCKNAQIPSPTYPASPASTTASKSQSP